MSASCPCPNLCCIVATLAAQGALPVAATTCPRPKRSLDCFAERTTRGRTRPCLSCIAFPASAPWARLIQQRARTAHGRRPRRSLPCTKCCASLRAAFAKVTATTICARIGEPACVPDAARGTKQRAGEPVTGLHLLAQAATDPPLPRLGKGLAGRRAGSPARAPRIRQLEWVRPHRPGSVPELVRSPLDGSGCSPSNRSVPGLLL